MFKNIKFSLVILLSITLGFALGKVTTPKKENRIVPIIAADQNFNFIKPLLGVDLVASEGFAQYNSLKTELQKIIEQYETQNKLTNASIYFRNLTDKSWLGINESEEYNPASLFKVPILLTYLKQAETDPSLLDSQITFNDPKDKANAQDIPPTKSIEFGKTYSIQNLLEYMIAYSDNSAANILAKRIYIDEGTAYANMFKDLGIQTKTNTISAKNYSLFFRILYNSTYLSRQSSENALKLLSKTDFSEGLRAGVPSTTVVAHKFGEYGSIENNQIIEELHDCGIIYTESNNYFLCVMTKGKDTDSEKKFIAEVSRVVFSDIIKKQN